MYEMVGPKGKVANKDQEVQKAVEKAEGAMQWHGPSPDGNNKNGATKSWTNTK